MLLFRAAGPGGALGRGAAGFRNGCPMIFGGASLGGAEGGVDPTSGVREDIEGTRGLGRVEGLGGETEKLIGNGFGLGFGFGLGELVGMEMMGLGMCFESMCFESMEFLFFDFLKMGDYSW
eukprot:649158-Amorphochlora_amoeboformis.AAC.1